MRVEALETVHLASHSNVLWLRLHTDEGVTGLGETFRGAHAVAEHLHREVAPQLLGQDPRAIECWSKRFGDGYLGYRSSGVEMRAASALDIALWDLFAKASGLPLYQALGGLARDRIRTYNTCAGYSYNTRGARREITADTAIEAQGPYEDQKAFMSDAGALAESLLEEGISAMKIWPFDIHAHGSQGQFIHAKDIEKGLEPFRRVREAVGDAMELMVELHSMWELPPAMAIARAIAPYRPFWMEDPIRMRNPAALASYARRSGLPVCASETIAGRGHFLDLLAADAVDYVMLDISWCGGLSEARKIAALAEAYQRPVAPHDCTGPIVYLASIHLALHCANAVFQESVRAYYTGWYKDVVTHVPTPVEGCFHPPEGPGHGADLLPELANRDDATHRRTTLADI